MTARIPPHRCTGLHRTHLRVPRRTPPAGARLPPAAPPPARRSPGDALWVLARLTVIGLAALWTPFQVPGPAQDWVRFGVAAVAILGVGSLGAVALRGLRLRAQPGALSLTAALALGLLGHAAGVRLPPPGSQPLVASPIPSVESDVSSGPRVASRVKVPGTPWSGEIPYEARAGALIVQVRVNGEGPFPMLWDTGASYTTLDSAALHRLGVPVPADAPIVTVHTASGTDQVPAVVVDRVAVAGTAVAGLVVLRCNACASAGVVGLLGNNFASRYLATVDPSQELIRLTARDEAPNRADELRPFLDLEGTVWREPGGRTRVDVRARNRGPRPVRFLTVMVSPKDDPHGGFTVAVPDVPPRGEVQASGTGDAGSGGQFTIEPIEADW